MCCLFATLGLFGPRAATFVWWLLDPVRWGAAFDTLIWPVIGFFLLPWMTLMFVAVFPGGIDGFDYVWLIIGLAMDVVTWSSGAYGGRDRMSGAAAA
jgi:hypothetical protein